MHPLLLSQGNGGLYPASAMSLVGPSRIVSMRAVQLGITSLPFRFFSINSFADSRTMVALEYDVDEAAQLATWHTED